MDISSVNFLAVFVAALSSFIVGSLWYSPVLFGNLWMKENNFTTEDLKNANMPKLYLVTFILAFIIATNLAFFLGQDAGLTWGITAGALVGVGWVAAALGITYLYEGKSMRLFLINAGYQAVTITIMGGIIGIWQ